jgi:hypothetical protein
MPAVNTTRRTGQTRYRWHVRQREVRVPGSARRGRDFRPRARMALNITFTGSRKGSPQHPGAGTRKDEELVPCQTVSAPRRGSPWPKRLEPRINAGTSEWI